MDEIESLLSRILSRLDEIAHEMKKPAVEIRYLTLEQAGQYWGGKSAEAVRWHCRTGELPHIKLGEQVIIDKHDLDAMMQKHKVKVR